MAGRRWKARRAVHLRIVARQQEQERKTMRFLGDQPADSDAWLRPAKPPQCDAETWAFLHSVPHLELLMANTPMADKWTPQDELKYVRRGDTRHVA